ncbi:MAG: heme-binding protein [Pseudomonadota bacterium]
MNDKNKLTVVEASVALTDAAVMAMLRAGVDEAVRINQPQCIVIVDASGASLCMFRMRGAKFLSLKTARAKALTAASTGVPSAAIPDHVRTAVGLASGGDVTGLGGGLPIIVGEALLGGIGVGSGSPQQDEAVARAALMAIGANNASANA